MKYRMLGKTGLKVSVIGLGTWQLGGEWGKDFNEAEATAIVDAALELGINLIDTAECYGDHLSERLVGQAIKGRRDKFILATKFGHRFTGFLGRDRLWTPADVEKQLDGSLKALGADYIDLYQYHSPKDDEFEMNGLAELLQRLVGKGKIRFIGNSIGEATNAAQAEVSVRKGVSVFQVRYNRLENAGEEFIFPVCRRENIGLLARVPLASGYLSGKYKPGAKFASGDYRSTQAAADVEAKLREVEKIRANELPAGVDMASWALAWCLRRPEVSCVIPGCKSPAQVRQNAAAAELLKA